MLTHDAEAELLSMLLKQQPLGRFSAKQLGRKAHWRWDRDQYLNAAVLFSAAAIRSAEEARVLAPLRDNTFNYHIRAGVTFRLAGEYERAWPLLLEATTFDWKAAGIPEDDHFTEWAFVDLLSILAEREDRHEFSRLFWQAVARCQELDSPFPRVHPKQELLLDLCERLGLSEELAHVIQRIETQRTPSKQLAQRIAQLKAALPTSSPESNT
jgi:hypothetical protein